MNQPTFLTPPGVYPRVYKLERLMKKRLLAIAVGLCVTLCLSCEDKVCSNTSKCPDRIIEKAKCGLPFEGEYISEIWEWRTENKIYYYVSTDLCNDCFNYLYDENCKRICAPDGGFSGAGDLRCPTLTTPIQKKRLWPQ